MPTYDYECIDCANIEEIFHSMFGKPKVRCSVCDGKMQHVTLVAPAGMVECQTVGSLMDRNAERMSKDEKESITPTKKHDIKEIKRRLK